MLEENEIRDVPYLTVVKQITYSLSLSLPLLFFEKKSWDRRYNAYKQYLTIFRPPNNSVWINFTGSTQDNMEAKPSLD